jgi:DNA polymerase-3 subunit alpha
VSKIRKKLTKTEKTMAFATVEDMYGSVNVIMFPKVYEQLSESNPGLLRVGAILKFTGTVSIGENGDADVLCNRVDGVEKKKDILGHNSNENTAKAAKKIKNGLYLRVPSFDSEAYLKAQKIITDNKGETQVTVKAVDTGVAKRLSSNNNVNISDALLSALVELLGIENVVNISD